MKDASDDPRVRSPGHPVTPSPIPGPDDPPAAARDRLVALLADLARDRDALAEAGETEGVAAYDALIDAARRVLNNLGRPPARR